MISLRQATVEDVPLLKYWDTKQHVIDCDPEGPWDWDEELKHNPAWREQFVAMKGVEPVGFIQIIDPALEESHYLGDSGAQSARHRYLDWRRR